MIEDDKRSGFKSLAPEAKKLLKEKAAKLFEAPAPDTKNEEKKQQILPLLKEILAYIRACKDRGEMPPPGLVAEAFALACLCTFDDEITRELKKIIETAREAVEVAMHKIYSSEIVFLLDTDPIKAVDLILYSDKAGKITKEVMDKFARGLEYDPHGDPNKSITNNDLANLHQDILSEVKREARQNLFSSLHTKWVPLHEMVVQGQTLNNEQSTRKSNLEVAMFSICENELVDQRYQKLQRELEQEKGKKTASNELAEAKGAEMFVQYHQVLDEIRQAKQEPHKIQELFQETARIIDQRAEAQAVEKARQEIAEKAEKVEEKEASKEKIEVETQGTVSDKFENIQSEKQADEDDILKMLSDIEEENSTIQISKDINSKTSKIKKILLTNSNHASANHSLPCEISKINSLKTPRH